MRLYSIIESKPITVCHKGLGWPYFIYKQLIMTLRLEI